ncbi:MAG: hypothetical protein JMN24_02610, partial [gamma proteobacterium endosymbiont of Lamellibrachia anaximandri]|nr:hypothetical protein [gamma proteobacterium endosymbiont of Lamellibrachia anaximandri]
PRSDAYFASPLAQGTPGKQCGLAATGDYQPSLRSPWLAARVLPFLLPEGAARFSLVDISLDECWQVIGLSAKSRIIPYSGTLGVWFMITERSQVNAT